VFAVPLVFKLHDGIEAVTETKRSLTLVNKMAHLCVTYMQPGSYVLLDAYYASVKLLKPLRQKGSYLITRVRCTTVADAPFSPRPGKFRGRPRQWGSPIRLQELFAAPKHCFKTQVWLYGQFTTVYYQCFQFVWDRPDAEVLFVLTQLPNGKQLILLASDTSLTGAQVIQAYGKRFKIELCFRTLIHLLGGFAYQFWLKLLPNTSQFPSDLRLSDFTPTAQRQIQQKVEAFERFVNLNAIALGVLQILALECPNAIWQDFPRWFRTHPEHGYPSEQIVRLTLQHQLPMILGKSRPALLLSKLLTDKSG
jgi:Transposase DDE domain